MSKELFDGLSSVMGTYGLCSICDGEHAWANVKCDLLECVHEWVVEKGNSFCVWCSVPESGE